MSTLSNLKFKSAVRRAFPDKSSARAARFAGVAQRTMQKWMSEEAEVPPGIATIMAHQGEIVTQTEVKEKLEHIMDEFFEHDGHPEVFGSILADLYQRLLDKPIA